MYNLPYRDRQLFKSTMKLEILLLITIIEDRARKEKFTHFYKATYNKVRMDVFYGIVYTIDSVCYWQISYLPFKVPS